MAPLLAECKELMDQIARLPSGGNNLIEMSPDLVILCDGFEGQFTKSKNGGQAVIEFMCDPSGQGSDCLPLLEVLRLSEEMFSLLFRQLAGRDLFVGDD